MKLLLEKLSKVVLLDQKSAMDKSYQMQLHLLLVLQLKLTKHLTEQIFMYIFSFDCSSRSGSMQLKFSHTLGFELDMYLI